MATTVTPPLVFSSFGSYETLPVLATQPGGGGGGGGATGAAGGQVEGE
jgi:hypothetical protein